MQTEMQAYELSTCLLLPAVGKLWLLINALGDKDVPVDSTHMTAVILNVIMSIAITVSYTHLTLPTIYSV